MKRTTEVVDFLVICHSSVSRTQGLTATNPSSELLGYCHSSAIADYRDDFSDKVVSTLKDFNVREIELSSNLRVMKAGLPPVLAGKELL